MYIKRFFIFFHKVVKVTNCCIGNLETNTEQGKHNENRHSCGFATSEFIQQIHLHLPLFALTLFKAQTTSIECKTFYCKLRYFYSKNVISVTCLSYDTSKCRLTQGDSISASEQKALPL